MIYALISFATLVLFLGGFALGYWLGVKSQVGRIPENILDNHPGSPRITQKPGVVKMRTPLQMREDLTGAPQRIRELLK